MGACGHCLALLAVDKPPRPCHAAEMSYNAATATNIHAVDRENGRSPLMNVPCVGVPESLALDSLMQ